MRFDLRGQLTAVIALGALAWALIEGGAAGFASLSVVAGFTLAAASLAAFVVIEARHRAPVLPLGLFRRPAIAAPAFLGLLVNIAFYGPIFVFSLLWQERDHYSALGAGLAFLPMTGAVLVAYRTTGRLAALVGTRPVILTGLAAMAAGCAGLLFAGPVAPFAQIVGAASAARRRNRAARLADDQHTHGQCRPIAVRCRLRHTQCHASGRQRPRRRGARLPDSQGPLRHGVHAALVIAIIVIGAGVIATVAASGW